MPGRRSAATGPPSTRTKPIGHGSVSLAPAGDAPAPRGSTAPPSQAKEVARWSRPTSSSRPRSARPRRSPQPSPSCPGVTLAEDVTGPYDVIARVEASTVDELGKLVIAKIQDVAGHHPHADLHRRPRLSVRRWTARDGARVSAGRGAGACRAVALGLRGCVAAGRCARASRSPCPLAPRRTGLRGRAPPGRLTVGGHRQPARSPPVARGPRRGATRRSSPAAGSPRRARPRDASRRRGRLGRPDAARGRHSFHHLRPLPGHRGAGARRYAPEPLLLPAFARRPRLRSAAGTAAADAGSASMAAVRLRAGPGSAQRRPVRRSSASWISSSISSG